MGSYVLIDDPSQLFIGKEIHVKYIGSDRYRKHIIRKRILLADHNIPIFDLYYGKHSDETKEEYAEYRKWLLNRIRNKEAYEYREDQEQARGDNSTRSAKGGEQHETGGLFGQPDNLSV